MKTKNESKNILEKSIYKKHANLPTKISNNSNATDDNQDIIEEAKNKALYEYTFYDELIKRTIPFIFRTISCVVSVLICLFIVIMILCSPQSNRVLDTTWGPYLFYITLAILFGFCYISTLCILYVIKIFLHFLVNIANNIIN